MRSAARHAVKRLVGWMLVALFGAWTGWSALTLPPASRPLDARADGATTRAIVRGAYHIHSTDSDGTGSAAEIAGAARRAGLDFVILTDHADGTRPLAPTRYHDGVLSVQAVEISTDDGHYAALGLGQPPYRLGGEGRDVAEDVDRLGGLGIVAHPDSAKPGLQWRDWTMPIGGFEWFNADTEWRDERVAAFIPALAHYLFRKPETIASLFDRPAEALATWDRLTERARVVGLAAADAHARLGGGDDDPNHAALYVPFPSYEAVFRAFSLQVVLDEPFDGRARHDARRLLDAIRAGRVITTFDALAAPARVTFEAESAGAVALPGGALPAGPAVVFRIRSNAPAGATIDLLRHGRVVHQSSGPDAEWLTSGPGAFRVEIRLPDAPGLPPVPWVVTNPIYVGIPDRPPSHPSAQPGVPSALGSSGWRVERDGSSEGDFRVLSAEGAPFESALSFKLAPAPAESPYVAAVTDEVAALADADALTFTAFASRPLRLSVQLRVRDGARDRRWRRSLYLDQTPRDVVMAFLDMRGIADATGQSVPVRDVTSLLFVVDTVNAVLGDSGSVSLAKVGTLRFSR